MSTPQDPGGYDPRSQPPPGQWNQPPPPNYGDAGPQGGGYGAPPPPPPPPPGGGYDYGYQSPGPSTGPAGGPPAHTLGEFWPRLGSAIVDGIIVGVVSSVIAAILGIGSWGTGGFGFAFRFVGNNPVQLVLAAAYYTYFHASPAGQTLGNKLLGLRVVDANTGGSLPWVRALVRWAMSLVSGAVILIGYLWMLWDPRKQTWHDIVAQSLVVKERAYPAPPGSFGKPPSL
jgi:uncharacterized RDD family membrane protein YckC